MAAILCGGIGACCKGLGQCLSLPFQACSSVCGETCTFVKKSLTSPFTPYLLTTFALNLPPTIWGARAFLTSLAENQRCQGDSWLWVNSGLALVHILAAFYIVFRIQEQKPDVPLVQATVDGQEEDTAKASAAETGTSYQKMSKGEEESNTKKSGSLTDQLIASVATTVFPVTKTATATPSPEPGTRGAYYGDVYEEGEANSVQRLKQLFCYDAVMAVYILAAIFWCVWQSVGISQALVSDDGQASDLCDSVENWSSLSIMCGFLYAMLVFVAFCCSFMCLKR
eukprot:CAMPEP_0172455388 /NCGR_PEP_ID=MMETSP1065-20121228/12043_1 /TAXON_ID=265537 /ORGANISM="Amphiprora paludosa, Strain CCMP125" /LENGTH=282 /DNA_ID=CAMNT_0013207849 /DNA_START=29 /DNA_END=877 /DNA_ORIENTATION=+